jgi:hypothetical protein
MKKYNTSISIRRRAIILYVFIILFVMTDNENFASEEDKMIQARQLFYQSVENSETIEEAITQFKEIAKNKTYEGLALTYIGALNALKGKFAFLPITKYLHVKKGLDLMDEGIAKSPGNIEARFIRGITCHYLPFFFKRKKTARHDFKIVVKQLSTDYILFDAQIVLNISDFLLENIKLTADEVKIIRNVQHKVKKNGD